ncbi:MAG: hypothetical protein HKN24_02425 [Acidimicrobiales bacterium]|nr:hypothetical protein [Acidimicrobiales bacterium]
MSPSNTAEAPTRRWRYRLYIALATVVLVVLGGWFLLSDEKSATDHVQDAAAEMRGGDLNKAAEIFGLDDVESSDYRFVAWHIGWDAEPVFSEIVESQGSGDNTNFTGVVTYGDDSFYSKAIGETAATTVRGWVDEDGTVFVSSWPPPDGLTETEAELRPWVEANRPELVAEMFGSDFGGIHFSQRSGELRMEVLDDFLATR